MHLLDMLRGARNGYFVWPKAGCVLLLIFKNIDDPIPGFILKVYEHSLVKQVKNLLSFRQAVYCLRWILVSEFNNIISFRI